MLPALAVLLALSVDPTCGCCTAASEAMAQEPTEHKFCQKFTREWKYYKRVYYGHYDRQPFDYRFQFDYISAAGPSRSYWPIPPLASGGAACFNEVEYEARRSPRVTIAAGGSSDARAAAATSLKLRK